jgi:hypothetical protein
LVIHSPVGAGTTCSSGVAAAVPVLGSGDAAIPALAKAEVCRNRRLVRLMVRTSLIAWQNSPQLSVISYQ